MSPALTRFQEYAKNRLEQLHPEWKSHLKDWIENDQRELVYTIDSPANANNKLLIVITPDDITVKFAVQGSHEHYDIDFVGDGSEDELFKSAFDWAFDEYITPVLENQLVAVWHHGPLGGTLTFDAEKFLELNPEINVSKIETWS